MAQIATYSEISDYLRTLPAASLSWAEGLYAANLSMGAVVALVETMMDDVESPLRAAQEGVMSQEIVKLNLTRGCGAVGKDVASKMGVRVRNVLSATERTRVVRSVNSFAQPIFEARGSFGRNGHAVMNAVRRICAAYMGAKIPKNATIIEVGPDVRHSLMSPTSSRWIEEGIDYYTGARPNLVPRDILRTDWQRMVAIVRKYGVREFSSATVAAAELMADNYSELFPDATIQELKKPGEYITSYDSNYDVAFSDMPKSMALCGARAWHGCMVRAKGLTSRSRVDSGKLDLLGVNYRVDWKTGKISFRHPECSAFGYTHNVWEYMKYEENNGFVWTGQNFHFVYSKSPETTSELLFFSVVRIPSALRIMEPRYVEHVYAGMMRLTSVWAVGDEINGIPNSFQQIVFHVDALNFSKVLEKRRALDHKGDLSVTVNLVRATNVRFWLNGTPVGASERIESRLAEAAAVLIETVVAERRRETNLLFDKAMYEFDLNVKRSGLLVRLLSSIFDVRAAAGCVSGPITRMWSSMRGALIDAALAPISKLSVGYERVEEHILLGLSQTEHLNEQIQLGTNSSCKCLEIADCYAAVLMAGEAEQADLLGYIGSLRVLGKTCKCEKSVAEIEYLASEEKKTDSGYGSGNATDTSDCLEDDESVSDEGDVTCIDISDCWRDDANINTPEWRSMDEFLRLETYLQTNLMIEIRSDVVAIEQQGRITQMTLEALTTPRTSHNYIRIMGHKVVERMGPDFGDYSAIYDKLKDRLVKVNRRGSAISVPVVDGWYYTCSRLAVWNFEEILAATNYALDYGVVDAFRKKYEVTMGVPGAGKTYSMMERLWKEYSDEPFTFFVLSATKAAALSATNVGVKFGFKRELLERCVMTADKYLMHKKMGAEVLCVDEVSAMHMGKVDVLSAIVGAKSIRLYGDAKQVPYDPFTAEFVMEWNVLGDTVPLSNVNFMSQTHRFGERMCAIWVDCYPAIYPCTCCQTEEKENMQISMIRHRDLSHLSYDPNVRYHTYRQNEKEELRNRFGLRESPEVLRAKPKGGMATVHEDQGSTHSDVVTVRIHSEYDKNASSRNPSLYNRVNYVLSDMTRAVDNYLYYTMCEEDDEICKRIKLAKDEERLKCVREKRAFGSVSLRDMLF